MSSSPAHLIAAIYSTPAPFMPVTQRLEMSINRHQLTLINSMWQFGQAIAAPRINMTQ